MFDKLGVPKYLAMSKTPVSECLSFSLDARNFMKKDHGTDVYLRILRNFKNTPFIEHLTTASDFTQHLSPVHGCNYFFLQANLQEGVLKNLANIHYKTLVPESFF